MDINKALPSEYRIADALERIAAALEKIAECATTPAESEGVARADRRSFDVYDWSNS